MSESSSLEDRLGLMELDMSAREALRRARPLTLDSVSTAPDGFFAKARATSETRDVFADAGRAAGAKQRQIALRVAISSGQFDERYVRATTVGRP